MKCASTLLSASYTSIFFSYFLQLFSSAINPMCLFPVLLAKVNTFRLAFDQVQLRVSGPGQSRYLAGGGGDGAWINTPEIGGCKMAMFIGR